MTIRNVSSRGVMGISADAPERGDYVEIRCGTYVIVARVAWAGGGAFGATSQHAIEVAELATGVAGRKPTGERRKLPRAMPPSAQPPVATLAAASRRAGRWFDFLSVAALGAMLAALAGSTAYQAFGGPLRQVGEALGGGPNHSEIVR